LRYRLLNEPSEAESICLDVLQVDSENQQAIATLILALADRFDKGHAVEAARARELLRRLRDPYERAYYAGILYERQAKAVLAQGAFGAEALAFDLLHEGMRCFEQAEALRPPHNDDARLRWNTCARMIMCRNLRHESLERAEPVLE
jgi:hypothetical protein